MDEKPRRFFSLFVCLHILHLCFSLALLVAVVHNQLANNARFYKVEVRLFEGPSTDVRSNKNNDQERTGNAVDGSGFSGSRPRYVVKRSKNANIKAVSAPDDMKMDDNNTVTEPSIRIKEADDNETNLFNNNPITEDLNDTENATKSSYDSSRYKTLPKSKALLNESKENYTTDSSTDGLKPSSNETNLRELSRQNVTASEPKLNTTQIALESDNSTAPTSCTRCNSTAKIIKSLNENIDLVSCFDKLKVIITTHLDEGRHQKDCQLFGGTKGDRGEKGCAGTSFAEPVFRTNPKTLVFNERDTAVLRCTAVSNPSAQITWYRDNKLIETIDDMTSPRYVIDNRDVTPPAPDRARFCPSEIPHPVKQSTLSINQSNGTDTGRYSCMASNILGTAKYDIDILIQVYVQLTTIPSNITIVQGEDAVLSCRASGVPRPKITWYRKDDGPMPSLYSVVMGDLYIKNISKEEEGIFVCVAENVLGSRSVEATVTVNVFPEITSFVDHVITVNENTSLLLPCNATGFPLPELQWTKQDDTLPTTRSHFDSQALNISRVKYEDRGVYICTANNTVGVVNKTVQVFVQVSPRVIKSPKATEFGYLAKTKRLEFEVFSIPKANITWTRPYWDRKINRRFRMDNGSLVIDNVEFQDSGLYQAVARNSLGEIRISTFLVVREAILPIIVVKPHKEVMIYTEGQTVSLSCSAIGVPTPTVTWLDKDGNSVQSGKRKSTLVFHRFTASKRGRYTCKAESDYGKDEAFVYLIDNTVIRLAGSTSPYEGRVEIYRSSEWGTVCGKSARTKTQHGRIACQQLGFSDVETLYYDKAQFGSGGGRVMTFDCGTWDERLQDCTIRYPTYYQNGYYIRCGHQYDLGVKCK